MSLRRSGPARRTFPAAAGILITLLSTLAAPGAAGANATDVRGPDHPEKDWMGSTIRAHEGGDRADAPAPRAAGSSVEGVDVSSHNGRVKWSTLRRSGVRFAYVKATEGTSYTNPSFTRQYNGSYKTGMVRGAYHFALPNNSSGAAQAKYFVKHGGDWSGDGKTLPGALDMEYNPYGATCYGKSPSAMVSWIGDFFKTYRAHTGRHAVIYTSANWWKQCTRDSGRFDDTNPLWVPRYGPSVGQLPAKWDFHTIWQYRSNGSAVGDRNQFNGTYSRLRALARG
ncbi:lysozyme [Streptomyces sp. H27-D2]|uniref:lysozyme n=1 Tax=Streptomyces sp. H27-D2 TaxID=3046304 RepID=UPI002DBFA9D7|nr:lysozyme [Streptomyces sp. H27-D2]MEC4019927.1 lysozyme [Streptomyces sp. H27-D2]